jgi:hypothetical protein
MTTPSMTRLAGQALGSFLKTAGGTVSQAVEKAVLNKLGGAQNFVDAPGLMGLVARNPEATAKLVGSAAPAVAFGGAALGSGLVNKLMQPGENLYAQQQYSLPLTKQGTPVSHANQQYTPGASPITNAQAGEAMLEQQKFQHQLELIQARQAASMGGGSLYQGLNLQGYMDSAQRSINSPAPYYG